MKANRFAQVAWLIVIYSLFVILWGAVVRATGSGAGCGSHWPLCNGAVVPHSPEMTTLVEYGHRITSGLLLLLGGALFFWSRRAYPEGHPVRLGAALSLIFVILEALIGASLVLLEYVGDNASVARAIWTGSHLINTFLLVGVQTLTAWWASGGKPLRLRGQGATAWLLAAGLLGMLLVGATGAVTALGDTLFPVGSESAPTTAQHFLIRLRVVHPAAAVVTALYLLVAVAVVIAQRPDRATRRLALSVVALLTIQTGAGFLNIALLAPVWMQLVHLLLADLLWIAFILLAASALRANVPATAMQHQGRTAPQASG